MGSASGALPETENFSRCHSGNAAAHGLATNELGIVHAAHSVVALNGNHPIPERQTSGVTVDVPLESAAREFSIKANRFPVVIRGQYVKCVHRLPAFEGRKAAAKG